MLNMSKTGTSILKPIPTAIIIYSKKKDEKENWFMEYEYIMNKKIWIKNQIMDIFEQKYNLAKNTDIGTNEYLTNKIVSDSIFENEIFLLNSKLKNIIAKDNWLFNYESWEQNSYEKTKEHYFNRFNKNLLEKPIEFGIDALECINLMPSKNHLLKKKIQNLSKI